MKKSLKPSPPVGRKGKVSPGAASKAPVKKSSFTVALNRKARFDYVILKTFEGGLVLKGSEVKSLRKGSCQLKDSYVVFRRDEAYVQKMHISPYGPAAGNNHPPERRRKLLLHRQELNTLSGQLHQKGMSCVPLKLYFKNGKAKVELALVKGKKKGDKREALKRKSLHREAQRALKKNR